MVEIEIKRGYEVLPDNRVKFGIRVINNGDSAISDVEVILDYSQSLFELESNKIETLGTIPPSIPRTAKFMLKPLSCVHEEEIGATIRYKDHKWEKHTIDMLPKEIHCVCPFLKEKIITRSDFLKLFNEGYSEERGLNFENIKLEKITDFITHTCKNRLYKVDEFSLENGKIIYLAGDSIGEKAHYLLTAVIIEREEIVQVLFKAKSNKEFGIKGFLNEVVENLRHLVQISSDAKEIGVIKREQVINIIDSVVQHTNFSGGEKSSVNIQDSVVQRTSFVYSQKVDFAREQLKKLISEAKPVLCVKLDKISLNLNEWHKSRIDISNEGNAHAFDINLFFSDDFEVRRIEPVSINAGDKKYLEIALKPLVKGDIPLEIVAKYRTGREESCESKYSFWINVKGSQETDKAKEENPSSKLGTVRAFPSTFPEELTAKYKDIEYIDKGGFARVFKARGQDEKLVAVKLLNSSDAITGESFISLMNWTGLLHENIVKLYEFNILPVPYFEMELCDCALSERQFPLDVSSSAWIIFNICEGLKYAHSKSIIHQDLKPQNILLKEGIPKISDWGLSKSLGYTVLYASPEHISKRFGKIDVRTNIWQVGIIFYEIITGKNPFEGDDPVAIMSGITLEDPEPPSLINPDAEKLDSTIMKCLRKKQEMRYQSVSELQRDLAEFLRIDYTQSLKISIPQKDLKMSAFYCGDLLIVHLKLGELVIAYNYATELLHYAQGDLQDIVKEFCGQLEVRISHGIDSVPDELMEKAKIIVHKIGFGFRK